MAEQQRQGDKATIRDLTEEAISNGWSKAAIRRMRGELADALQVSRLSLNSVSAYVNYSATQAVRACGLEGRLTNAQLITAARLVRGSGSRPDDLRVLAADLGLAQDELDRAVARYEGYYRNRPDGPLAAPGNGGATPTPVQGPSGPAGPEGGDRAEPPPVTAPVSQPPPADQPPVEGPGGGADDGRGDLISYDYEAKREWRRAWRSFIRDHLTPRQLRNALVLCLPGRAVEHEVAHYLEMGVPAGNIHCVEGSPRVRDEFLANAARLGVHAHPSSLEPAVGRLAAAGLRFSIVNLDFHGQHCATHRRALVQTPLADDAILIYNALAKRESSDVQFFAGSEAGADAWWLHWMNNEFLGPSAGTPLASRLARPLSHLTGLVDDDSDTLGRIRDGHLPSVLVRLAGIAHRRVLPDFGMSAGDPIPTGGPGSEDVYLEEVMRRKLGTAWQLRAMLPIGWAGSIQTLGELYPTDLFVDCGAEDFGLVLWHAASGEPATVGAVASHEYLSEAAPGRARSPFVTTMARVVQADTLWSGHQEAVAFGLAFARELVQLETARAEAADAGLDPAAATAGVGLRVEVMHPSGFQLPVGMPLDWDHTLALRDRYGYTHSSVKAGALRQAMLAARSLERKDRILL